MHGEREPAEHLGTRVVGGRGFKASLRSLEPQAQGKLWVHVANLTQESMDLIGALVRDADGAERGVHFGFAGGHGLEQGALELPATRGPVGINATPARIKRSARLREFFFADCRLRIADF